MNLTIALRTALLVSPIWFAAPLALADEVWKIKPVGRILADYTFADADAADVSVRAGELRTARLGVQGEANNLSFKLDLTTDSSGEVFLTDAYLDFKPGGGDWTVRVGQYKTPNSLDEVTSGLFNSTYERAAFTDAFDFDRRLGIAAIHQGDRHTFDVGLFAANLNDTALEEGTAAATRFTYVPLKTDTLTTHLGISARWRERGEDQPLLRYRQRPYARDPGRIVSTGPIADADLFYGLEGMALWQGQSWVAAEYGGLKADVAAGDDATLGGAFIEAGHIFGGKRTYKKGRWDRPVVTAPITEKGPGAFQVSARYDRLDLSDGVINGGALDTIVLSADWWATSRARFGVNLFSASADLGSTNSGLGPGFAALRTRGVTQDDVTGATLRLQVDF